MPYTTVTLVLLAMTKSQSAINRLNCTFVDHFVHCTYKLEMCIDCVD